MPAATLPDFEFDFPPETRFFDTGDDRPFAALPGERVMAWGSGAPRPLLGSEPGDLRPIIEEDAFRDLVRNALAERAASKAGW